MNLVSVIVPIYNVENYLARCINSLMQQTYSNIEILLINDGSKDNCELICQEFLQKDNRIRYYKKENGGLSSARNYGIDRAKGDYLVFVDSDDYVSRKMIKVLLETALSNDADMVECEFLEFFENEIINDSNVDNALNNKSYSSYEAISSLICNTGITPIAWNKIYKKEIFNKLRYKVGIYHEDEEIIVKLLNRCKKICKIDNQLYFYMKRNGSITNSKFNKRHLDIIKIMDERIQILKSLNCNKHLISLTTVRFSNICNELYVKMLLSDVPLENEKSNLINLRNKIIKDVLKSDAPLSKKLKALQYYLFPKITYKLKYLN